MEQCANGNRSLYYGNWTRSPDTHPVPKSTPMAKERNTLKETGRKIVDGPLPQGNLPKGHIILSPPTNRQFFLKHYAAVRAWFRYYWPMRKEATSIFLNDNRSWGKRVERVRGAMVAKAMEAAYSGETMHDAGLRLAECVCYGECTCLHCEHPPRQSNSQRRKERRNRPRGRR